MDRRTLLSSWLVGLVNMLFGRFKTTKPTEIWTHDADKGDRGVVYDANGVDLGRVIRCNVFTGDYEAYDYDLKACNHDKLKVLKLQAKAPLKVNPLAVIKNEKNSDFKWVTWEER